MKREIFSFKDSSVNWCCPGHDDWPDETYRNNRSKRARSRDKKKEHRYVRRHLKQNIDNDVE